METEILKNTRENTPLVHCITNYVTVNDCANIILATGGSPVMADEIQEVEDIVKLSSALVINMGTLNKFTAESMVKATKKANEINCPVVFDPVGAGASQWRNNNVKRFLSEAKFDIIRGNISEMKVVYYGSGSTQGVDAKASDVITEENLDKNVEFAKDLSKRTGAIIAISGAIDIIADENKAYVIRNGHEQMTRITGSGCMSTAVIGALCGANKDNLLEATAVSVIAMGLSGEYAHQKVAKEESGLSSFRMHMIDFISNVNDETIKEGAKVEIK